MRGAGDHRAERRQRALQVDRGRLALDVRVGRDDHLGNPFITHAVDQLRHVELLGSDAVDGRDHTVQHEVQPGVFGRAFHRQHVERGLHHAHHRLVATGRCADGALRALRDVVAALAVADARLHIDDRLRKRVGPLAVHAQHVKGESLSGLRPHAGQARELADQPFERLRKLRHASVLTAAGLEAGPCPRSGPACAQPHAASTSRAPR